MASAAVAIVITATTGVHAQNVENVGEYSQAYRITYEDGDTERYIANYTGQVRYRHWESGGPSKPLEGKFVDDRQCHWTIQSLIDRKVCLVSRDGRQYCQGNMNRVYGVQMAGQGSDFVLERLRPENCGDTQARYESDLNNARVATQRALQPTADSDRRRVESELSAIQGAASVARVSGR